MLSLIPSDILKAIRITLVFGLIGGVIYPLLITGISQVAFHNQANGSLIMVNGQVVGSSLIGQSFGSNKYFQGRISYNNYNAGNSLGSNLGPSNQTLMNNVASAARSYRRANGLGPNDPVPVDAVTSDFTGFDPDITEANALIQVNRVADARGLSRSRVHALVERYVHGRVLWIFGMSTSSR
jgi:potassium-transporting ATPase KdpC subunit